jgi:hypothetical protein
VGVRGGREAERGGGTHEDLVEAWGRGLEDTGAQDGGPVVRREIAERRTVDDGVDHLGGLSGLDEGGVVVAEGDGGDLGVPKDKVSDFKSMFLE